MTTPTNPWLTEGGPIVAGIAILSAALAGARWSWRHLLAFLALFSLPARLQALDAKVDGVRQHSADEVEAMRVEMDERHQRAERATSERFEKVAQELRTIAKDTAKHDDLKRVEDKLDRLLVDRFPGGRH